MLISFWRNFRWFSADAINKISVHLLLQFVYCNLFVWKLVWTKRRSDWLYNESGIFDQHSRNIAHRHRHRRVWVLCLLSLLLLLVLCFVSSFSLQPNNKSSVWRWCFKVRENEHKILAWTEVKNQQTPSSLSKYQHNV